ncbi:hypothetical protein DITRI_Ditri09bG0119300 [Diplodiscus trichospermus]
MSKMGFGHKWRRWIGCYLSTASISILVNGSPSRQFCISGGLRQGCPLSPFLFNLVGEGLSVLLHKAEMLGFFSGTSVRDCSLSVISGLKVNFHRSRLFGIGIERALVDDWAYSVCSKSDSLPTVYLGLPLGARSNAVTIWNPVIERVETKLACWKANFLSLEERVVLILSVLSCLPIFYLSLFHMPITVNERIGKIQRRFLWGGDSNKNKVHWVDWKSVCNYKQRGGLGIIDSSIKNRGFLNKWIWRLSEEDDAMWKKVIVGNYGGHESDLLPTVRNHRNFSALWRNIMKPLLVPNEDAASFHANICYSLGNGKKIALWSDEWIPSIILRSSFPRVYDLAGNKSGQWNQFYNLINSFQVCQTLRDCVVWKNSVSGRYYVQQFCLGVCNPGDNRKHVWKPVWSGLAPPKVETFGWQVIKRKIVVKVELAKRKILDKGSLSCVFCLSERESVEHLFFIVVIRGKFGCTGLRVGAYLGVCLDPASFLMAWNGMLLADIRLNIWNMSFFVVLWSIWKLRNEVVFKSGGLDWERVIDLIKWRVGLWGKARWPEISICLEDFIRCPSLVKIPKVVHRRLGGKDWAPPEMDCLKFNVDGSALGQPGYAGVGAVMEAFVLFSASCWVTSHKLALESDSANAVKWVKDPISAPWRFRHLLNQLENLKTSIPNWTITHILREANGDADCLAKAGAKRMEDHVMIFYCG